MRIVARALVAGILAGFGVPAVFSGEPSPDPKLFSFACSVRASPASISPVLATAASAELVADLNASRDVPIELSVQRYEAMNGGRLLFVPPPGEEPGGAYGYLKDKVFDPITTFEVVKVGKLQMTGGIVGAIKKKNPFCLLNPLVFAIDW